MKWEYKVICPTRMEDSFSVAEILNAEGKNGWELVSFELLAPITDRWFHAVFKRPCNFAEKQPCTK